MIGVLPASGGGSTGSNPAGGTQNMGNINNRTAGTRRHLQGMNTSRFGHRGLYSLPAPDCQRRQKIAPSGE
jgi:hypothetical protein